MNCPKCGHQLIMHSVLGCLELSTDKLKIFCPCTLSSDDLLVTLEARNAKMKEALEIIANATPVDGWVLVAPQFTRATLKED